MWPIKMHPGVISTLCSVHNAKISCHIELLQNVITRRILKITHQYLVSYTIIYTLPCPIVFGAIDIFLIFDPKCKLSDTPDCDWHVSTKLEIFLEVFKFLPFKTWNVPTRDILVNIFLSKMLFTEAHKGSYCKYFSPQFFSALFIYFCTVSFISTRAIRILLPMGLSYFRIVVSLPQVLWNFQHCGNKTNVAEISL